MNQVKTSLTTILLITLPLLTVILFVANIITHNILATAGPLLKTYSTQAQNLEQQNLNLHQSIANYSSLTYLMEQANLQGFTPIGSLTYLGSPEPLAQR